MIGDRPKKGKSTASIRVQPFILIGPGMLVFLGENDAPIRTWRPISSQAMSRLLPRGSSDRGQGFESPRLYQPNTIKGFRDFAPPEGPQKADAHPETDFHAALESFLLSRGVGNCSSRSVDG